MGDCRLCGRSAGFLKKEHKECRRQHEHGKREIVSLIADAATNEGNRQRLMAYINKTASSSYLRGVALQDVMATGFEVAVERALDDHLLTEHEETALTELKDLLPVAYDAMDRNGALTRVVKSAILRDITLGLIPQRQQIDGVVPFNLQKSETLVWVFQHVQYYEEKTRREFVGGSQGFSFRVTKGVYYRVGGFKGRSVETAETVHVDTGLLGVTTKHIYFAGQAKRFRINYNKIVSFEPYSDGIGVQRDAQTAKPQSFLTDDGWFTYNLVANLAQL
ncbi:MAG: hypothetical protein OXE46_09140 [Chloroflexi bacterium]|nr:hypothetical protein [Chloroflexota bacterium]